MTVDAVLVQASQQAHKEQLAYAAMWPRSKQAHGSNLPPASQQDRPAQPLTGRCSVHAMATRVAYRVPCSPNQKM